MLVPMLIRPIVLVSAATRKPAVLVRLCSHQPKSIQHLRRSTLHCLQTVLLQLAFSIAVLVNLWAGTVAGQPPRGDVDFNPAGPSSADAINNDPWQYRFDLFQMLLEQNGLEPVSQAAAFNSPMQPIDNLVLISLGRQDEGNIALRLVRRIAANGKVLIATDGGVKFDDLFEIRGGPVESYASEDSYRNFRDCVIAGEFPVQDPFTGQLEQLIVNRGGWIAALSDRYGSWQVHARYPRRVRPLTSARKPFLASMTFRDQLDSTLILAADHSILSNGMIWHGDNAMLAIELSRKLAGAGNAKMLFLVDGEVMTSYADRNSQSQPNPPLPKLPPLPPIDEIPPEALPEPTLAQMLKVANRVVSKVEDSDLINEVVANQPRRIREPYFRRLLLILASLLILTYAIYRLSRPPAIATSPSTTLAVGPPPIDTSNDFATAEQRGVAARFLARDFFIEQTGSTDSRKWREFFSVESGAVRGKAAGRVSRGQVSRWKRRSKSHSSADQDSVGYLIAIADSQHPPLLTTDQLTSFGVELEELRQRSAGMLENSTS